MERERREKESEKTSKTTLAQVPNLKAFTEKEKTKMIHSIIMRINQREANAINSAALFSAAWTPMFTTGRSVTRE